MFAFSSALTALLLIASGWLIWQTLQRKETPPDLTRTAKTTPSPTAPSVTPVVSPTLSIESAGELLAQLNDGGGQLMLDGDGNLSGPPGFDDLPPSYRQMVKGALSNQRLEKPQSLAGLTRPGSISIRSGEKEDLKFSVIEPVGKVILSDRPTLSWLRLDGATSYVVQIYDEALNLATISRQLTENSWTPPQSLQRGVIYSWQVIAIKDGQEFIAPRAPAPQAKFRILDQAKANEIRQARRAYSSSHLTLALLYTQAGLLDEAEQELRALQKANPNSAIVRRLLSNLRALRNK
jgi:hypothetical protein